jgi:hypothetical protein
MKPKQSKQIIKKAAWDHQKDSIFKELSAIMTGLGYEVRREELKQGHGWKVMSGSCRFEDQRLIFVDKKLPQDEQIGFLIGKILALNTELPQEKLAALPEKIRHMIQGVAEAA